MKIFYLSLAMVLWCSVGAQRRPGNRPRYTWKNIKNSYCYWLREHGHMMHCEYLPETMCPDTFTPKCKSKPLGMEDGRIPDSSITASSVYSDLFSHNGRKVWRAADNHGPNQWFKVDIGRVQRLYIMDIHGYSHGNLIEYVETFVLQYSLDGKRFRNYKGGQILRAGYFNRIKFRPAIKARYVKIIAIKAHNRAALWVELYRFQRGQFKPLLGTLHDHHFQFSSFIGSIFPAKEARLNNRYKSRQEPGAWRGKRVFGQWLQVDLSKVTTVTGIATQGAPDGMKANHWVMRYSLQFSNDGKTFYDYRDRTNVFKPVLKYQANRDRNTIVKNILPWPIHARYIRVITRMWNRAMVMRMELYGCESAPQRPSNYLNPTSKEVCKEKNFNVGYWCGDTISC